MLKAVAPCSRTTRIEMGSVSIRLCHTEQSCYEGITLFVFGTTNFRVLSDIVTEEFCWPFIFYFLNTSVIKVSSGIQRFTKKSLSTNASRYIPVNMPTCARIETESKR